MANRAKVSREQVREAVDQLRRQGREPTIPAIRGHVGGEGSNSTLLQHRDEYVAELAEQQAATRRLDADDAALARDLMERAVSTILARVESKAQEEIDAAIAKAEAETDRAQRLADEALVEAGQRVRERDDARQQLHDLGASHRETHDRAMRAEGQAQQQASEITRLVQALDVLQMEKEKAITVAADLRTRLQFQAEREQELLAELSVHTAARASKKVPVPPGSKGPAI